jgi:tryptophanyl-tRNA synthetase
MNAPKDPDTCIIYQIHKLFLDEAGKKALAAEYKNGLPYGDAKKKLLQTYLDVFAAMRRRRAALEKDDGYIRDVMTQGAKKAATVAEATMERVRTAVGLR